MNSMMQVQNTMLEQMDRMRSVSEGAAIKDAFEPPRKGGVGQVFEDILRAVDDEQHRASQALADVDSGKSKDLVGAMLLSQKASLSFSALVQVRNKMTNAFDEIMRMPV